MRIQSRITWILRVGLIIALACVTFLPLIDRVGVTPARAAAQPLTNGSPTYTQNFDTLGNTGTNPLSWTNDSTLLGWYYNSSVSPLVYRYDTGLLNNGSLYSYGAAASTERALGSVASGGTNTIDYGVRLINSGTTAITSLSVTYTGEQWRNGGNTTQHTLTFGYKVAATTINETGYTNVAALNFTGPIATATAAALNGNAAANRVAGITSTITVSVAVGQEIWLRWDDPNDAGNDHGLAIDDLTITATFAPPTAPQVTSTTPTNGATGVGVSNALSVTFNANVTFIGPGDWFTLSCNSSGTHNAGATGVSGGPSTFSITPNPVFAGGETCTVTIKAANVVRADDGTTHLATDYTFSFTTFLAAGACPAVPLTAPLVSVGAIQGNGATSPLVGQTRTLRGRVTGDFQNNPVTNPAQMGGFFVQNAPGGSDAGSLPDGDPLTSDGVYVFNSATPVNLGDTVQVTGTVAEFGPGTEKETQINGATITVCGGSAIGNVTPTVVSLPLPVGQSFEQYEGMLVTFSQPLYVVENFQLGRFGAFRVADQVINTFTHDNAPSVSGYTNYLNLNARRSFTIDDGSSAQNPDPILYPPPALAALNTLRGGDTVNNVIGIFRQTYGTVTSSTGATLDYRLHPVNALTAANFSQTNPRPTTPPTLPGKIKAGGFNVLNYFTDLDDGTCTFTIAGASGTQCRGADNATEFARQRTKTIAAICALNLDILGITEMENNPAHPNAAIDDLLSGLNSTPGCGPYAYVDTGIVGGDAIRVAILYKPATVVKVGNYAKLDNVAPFNVNTRPPVAQTFRYPEANETFTFVVNHLKSKSTSGCPSSGTNSDRLDGQGCWNDDRVAGVNALLTWLATNPTNAPNNRILMVGDYNSYAQEDPVKALATGGFVNLSQSLLGASAYSYRFDSGIGYLDYAFANAEMMSGVSGIAEWHINADEPLVLDYNTEFITAGQIASLYSPLPFRTSDHDPVIVGLFEPKVTWPNISLFDPAISKLGLLSQGGVGLPGERLTWVITVTNNGAATGTNIIVTDTLRPELRVDSAETQRGTFTIAGQTVSFTIPSLNPNETVTLRINTTVLTSPAGGEFVNDVTLAGSGALRTARGTLNPVKTLPSTGYSPAQSTPISESAGWLLLAGMALFLVGFVTIRFRKR